MDGVAALLVEDDVEEDWVDAELEELEDEDELDEFVEAYNEKSVNGTAILGTEHFTHG